MRGREKKRNGTESELVQDKRKKGYRHILF